MGKRRLLEMLSTATGLVIVLLPSMFLAPGLPRLLLFLVALGVATAWFVLARAIIRRVAGTEPVVRDLDELLPVDVRARATVLTHGDLLQWTLVTALVSALLTLAISGHLLEDRRLEHAALVVLLVLFLQHYLIPWWRLGARPSDGQRDVGGSA